MSAVDGAARPPSRLKAGRPVRGANTRTEGHAKRPVTHARSAHAGSLAPGRGMGSGGQQ